MNEKDEGYRLKQAQEALRKSEEELRFIAENVGDAIWQMDPEIRFTYISPAVRKILGYEPSEIVGRDIFQFITESSDEVLRSLWTDWYERLDAGTQSEELLFEIEAVRKDGQTVWLEVQARPLLDARGQITKYLGVTRDITRRRQAEEERRRLTDRLNRAEKMESLGILAGGVAHDLNNFLGIIVGYSELIRESLGPGDPLCQYVSDIAKSSEKSTAIIQDLLALARRGVVVREVIDLNALISEFLGSTEFERVKDHHQQVAFTVDLAGGLLPVKGSPVHIGRLIMNLVSNAAESIAVRGEVHIRTDNKTIDGPVPAYDEISPGQYAVLSVSDSGRGISEEELRKIFEPFYTKKVMGRSGTGLGLAVVWGTVKDHGGYIDVQSREEQGSIFSIYLPATKEEVKRAPRRAPIESYMGRGESILVVDDNPDQRQLATVMLKRLGYRVETAASGEEAVSILRDRPADLVIIDMIMDRGIDGLDTYHEIARIRPEQKAILVSGFSETDRVRKAQELGAGAYVRKPYTLEKIGLAIRGELAR